jgi:hypothetical protein
MPTEAQAKTMWCPHTAVRQPDSNCCIASQCMVWRWMPDYSAGQQAPLMELTSEKWVCEYCKNDPAAVQQCAECEGQGTGRVLARVGFCGAAGLPLLP